jgi:hypothetical protein
VQDISPATTTLIDRLFPGAQAEVRKALVDGCGRTVVGPVDDETLERIRFAVLKLTDGDLDRLPASIGYAKQDWRDVLTAAGFGAPRAHRRWADQIEPRAY